MLIHPQQMINPYRLGRDNKHDLDRLRTKDGDYDNDLVSQNLAGKTKRKLNNDTSILVRKLEELTTIPNTNETAPLFKGQDFSYNELCTIVEALAPYISKYTQITSTSIKPDEETEADIIFRYAILMAMTLSGLKSYYTKNGGREKVSNPESARKFRREDPGTYALVVVPRMKLVIAFINSFPEVFMGQEPTEKQKKSKAGISAAYGLLQKVYERKAEPTPKFNDKSAKSSPKDRFSALEQELKQQGYN